eukprot:3661900-Rhodomonas_salina.2
MELDALGLLTSPKNEQPAQVGQFLGLGWDTVRGVFFLTEAKAAKLAGQARALLEARTVSQLQAAQFRGCMQWYSVCLEGVLILTRQLTHWIGAPDAAGWDAQQELTPGAREERHFWADNVEGMAGHAKPMWK